MAKHLISVIETYRVDSEDEVARMIKEAKEDDTCELVKHSSVKKERRQKGEIIDAWYRLSLTKLFDDEKEPCSEVSVSYQNGAF